MNQQVPAGSRRGIRRSVELDCEVVSSRTDELMRFTATDLSTGGMWLQTADPVRAGEQVVVCFEPHEEWSHGELMVFAEVARVTTSRRRLNEPGVGMGLEFLDLGSGEREALETWLSGRKKPVPRRRRPVPRFDVPHPTMTRTFDEIRGTTALTPVNGPPIEAPRPAAPSATLIPPSLPIGFRPLVSAWR